MHYCTMHFLLSPWPVITLQRFSMEPETERKNEPRLLAKDEETRWILSNQAWLRELTNGLPIRRVQVEPACPPGENFVSKVERVKIFVVDSSNIEIQKSVIIKEMLPVNSAENQIMDCKSMFDNEISAYREVLPLLFQTNSTSKWSKRKRKIPRTSRTSKNAGESPEKIFPRCYFMDERLVLQDLSAEGFTMANRKKGLTFEECQQALKSLASFHSHSFVLKTRDPRLWQECHAKPRETVFSEKCTGAIIEVFWNNALKTAQRSLRASEDKKLIKVADKLSVYEGRVLATLRRLTECSKDASPMAAICHGDLWSNNILFKYGDDKRPVEARLLDLQAMRHTSIALDLLHLLCTSTQNLGKNFHLLLQHYMDNLENAPFRMEELLEQIREKVIFGVLLGFMIIPCATSDPSESTKKCVEARTSENVINPSSTSESSKVADRGEETKSGTSRGSSEEPNNKKKSSRGSTKSLRIDEEPTFGVLEKSPLHAPAISTQHFDGEDANRSGKSESAELQSKETREKFSASQGSNRKRSKSTQIGSSSKKTKNSTDQPQLTREFLDSDAYREKCYQQLSQHCHLRIRQMVLDLLELNVLTDSSFS